MSRRRLLRVVLDGTPLLGQRTGIGRYTAALLDELAGLAAGCGLDVGVSAFSLRGHRSLRSRLPAGVRARGLPVPARVLRAAWRRLPVPPIELLVGAVGVMHATNFVLPPAIRAAGVLTVHDLAFLDRPDELAPAEHGLPALVRAAARRAAVVCTPTTAVARQVVQRLGVRDDRIVVTPLGVDPAWFVAAAPNAETRRRLRLPKQYLLFVGTAQPRKGLDVLLAAHAAAPSAPPLVLAGAAGWGPQPADPEPAERHRVLRTGYLSEVDLRRVVAGATALVLPSRDEGFGLPLLEALACGIPVITTDAPALLEVAGGHAQHVPVGDVDALAHALATVDAAARDAETAAARRAHASEFTWRACAESTVDAYRLAAG
jgi:glycosyltransferase involved in cell wall biosynthesis